MTHHDTVVVTVGDMTADIDRRIAPLITELWKADIMTLNSCEENKPGIVWIEFASCIDAERFLNIVARYPNRRELARKSFSDTLYGRCTSCDGERHWEYDALITDYGIREEIVNDEVIVTEVHPADFTCGISIRFPHCDLPVMLRRLRQYNHTCDTNWEEMSAP
jgi:hypothetical protein